MAIGLLTLGVRYTDASSTLGISPEALRRWRGLPEFAAALGEQRASILRAAEHEMLEAALVAVDALVSIARDDGQLAKDRLAAAVAILDRAGLGPRSSLTVSRGQDANAPPDVSQLSDDELATLSTAHAIERKLLGGG